MRGKTFCVGGEGKYVWYILSPAQNLVVQSGARCHVQFSHDRLRSDMRVKMSAIYADSANWSPLTMYGSF